MAEGSGKGDGRRFWIGVLVLLAAAAATRFFRLASWPLFGDEIYTLQASTDPGFSGIGSPLVFWLNHHLVQPFLPLDELGLRLLPALFGVAGVGVVVGLGRRLVGERAALFAGALVVLNPWHLAMSQFARYYTLVFLLAAISPAALYLGVKERSRGWTAVGVVAAVLGWFAHPTTILPTAGFLVWLAGHALVRTEGRRRRLLLGAIGAAALAGVAAAAAVLRQWTSLGQAWGIGGIWMAVSYGMRLGTGPAVAAAAGLGLLWIRGRRELALFLAAAVGAPLILLGLLGRFVSVRTAYLFATAPYALLAVGAFLDGTIRAVEERGTSLLLGASAAGLVVATVLPSLVSHYVDGGKVDFRGAARHVEERAGPNDLVLPEHTGPFVYYTPSLEARPLVRDTARLDSLRRALGRSSPPGTLWIVPYLHSEGGFGLAGLGAARSWVWRHCRLSARYDPVRIDHERNIAEVWRCPGGRTSGRAGGGTADGEGGGPGEGDRLPDGEGP